MAKTYHWKEACLGLGVTKSCLMNHLQKLGSYERRDQLTYEDIKAVAHRMRKPNYKPVQAKVDEIQRNLINDGYTIRQMPQKKKARKREETEA